VLLTGIHLMRTGIVEANLARLNEQFRLRYIDDLIAQKVGGTEDEPLREADFDFHAREYQRLTAELEQASEASSLPDGPTSRAALNDLLIRLRRDAKDI
jgi:predicted nucleotidyltransferase